MYVMKSSGYSLAKALTLFLGCFVLNMEYIDLSLGIDSIPLSQLQLQNIYNLTSRFFSVARFTLRKKEILAIGPFFWYNIHITIPIELRYF